MGVEHPNGAAITDKRERLRREAEEAQRQARSPREAETPSNWAAMDQRIDARVAAFLAAAFPKCFDAAFDLEWESIVSDPEGDMIELLGVAVSVARKYAQSCS
jgi:hypothetical protein